MLKSFHYPLVALSVLAAICVANTALSLFLRVARSRGRRHRRLWLCGGALAMGSGIWATHFLGMLALMLPTPVTYDLPKTAASLGIAIATSMLALSVAAQPRASWRRPFASACLLGGGISAMHYCGMAAIQIVPPLQNTPMLMASAVADESTGSFLAVMALMTVQLDYDGQLATKTRQYHEGLEVANAKLHHAATHDSLTGLPNRLLLAHRLDELIGQAAGTGERLAVLLIDLDRFKEINDSLGHPAGDDLLCTLSARLRSQVRVGTALARLGGDEFVVVIDNLRDGAHAAGVASRLQKAIAGPVTLCGVTVHVSASVGIARFPEDGANSPELLQRADAALYHVKKVGRGGQQFYSAEVHTPSRERLEVEDALRRALTLQQFELHYQPKVELRTGRIEGAEALIRKRHPQHGLIAPADFIPLAEETGLIVPIGEWTHGEAIRQAQKWQRTEVGILPVAVNVSAKQFEARDFAQVVTRIVLESGLDPRLLEQELTESAVMRDPTSSIAALRRLTDLGIAISLDDFGTGYSSLSLLRRLPLTKLKIDRSFIQELETDPGCAQIVRAIVSLGHNLHLQVIAEGVETADQLGFLREAGCDKYQGYFCSRPLPAEQFTSLVVANRTTRPAGDESVEEPAGALMVTA